MSDSSFTKKEHLRKADSIRHVFDKGLLYKAKSINIYLLKTDRETKFNQVAFIISKNLYNKKLVLRNRIRRILREAYRKTKHILPLGFDMVILATRVKKDTKSPDIEQELRDVFKKCIEK